ncbi:MAG: hypothetical protein C0501_14535 [Isosphaera sp.]|nr:hypothetical protein [Isosphaera sp.]
MTPNPDQARADLQHLLDGAADGDVVRIDPPRERPGPVVVRSGVTVEGAGCTVWGQTGPVVIVRGPNAVLKDLRIEHTADGADAGPAPGVALWVEGAGLGLENVTVRGAVVGLAAEAGEWRYPHQLNLGGLAAGMPHDLRLRVAVPVPCQLTSEVAGVVLEPRTLGPGCHEVRLRAEAMLRDTLVFGTIGIKTAFLRREIVLNAHFLSPADGLPDPARGQGRVVWEPPDWAGLVAAGPPAVAAAPSVLPTPAIPNPPPRAVPDIPPPPEARPAAAAPPPPAVSPPPAPVPPPVVAAPRAPASPPPPPTMRPTKTIKGPLLGSLFTSPPVKSPPVAASPPPPESPPPAAPKPLKKPGLTLGGAFAPKPPAPAAPPVAPPPPPPPDDPGLNFDFDTSSPGDQVDLELEAPPAPPAPPPPAGPPKMRFRPSSGSPLFGPKPPTDPPA